MPLTPLTCSHPTLHSPGAGLIIEFRSGKASDIINTLVSIFETREVIIKELQVLLASRLLAVKDYDAVKEIRTIELLKLRFGEAALGVCDVMLKDMADSKRIDGHVHGDIEVGPGEMSHLAVVCSYVVSVLMTVLCASSHHLADVLAECPVFLAAPATKATSVRPVSTHPLHNSTPLPSKLHKSLHALIPTSPATLVWLPY